MLALSYQGDEQAVGDNGNMAVQRSTYDVRIAFAIAIIKARRCAPNTERELHWKKKAKILKDEILALRRELQDIEDGSILDKLPCLAPCECLFLNTRVLEAPRTTTDAEVFIGKLSVQRFLKNLRILNRAKKNGRKRTRELKVNTSATDLKGHLALVVDFLADVLGDPIPVSDSKNLSTYMHQSVNFIEEAIPHLLQDTKTQQLQVQTSVKKLTSALSMNIMNFLPQKGIETTENIDTRVWIQKIVLDLGSIQCIGQQLLLTIARVIAEIAETLVCVDPFHDGVAQTYSNLFFLLQLFERLLSDHLCTWAKTSTLDEDTLQEAVKFHFQTINLFQEFGNWSSLVVFYTNRITGELISQLYKIVALHHKAEGSKHSALLHLVESATSSVSVR
ncbi:unnamed protein product [Calypogeia fissa]